MSSSLLSYSFTKFMTSNYAYRHIINTYGRDIVGVHHVSFRSLKENTNLFDKNEYILQKETYEMPEYNAKIKTYKNNNSLSEYNDNTNILMALNLDEYNVHKMVIPTIYYSYYDGHEENRCDKMNKMIDVLEEEGKFGEIYSYNDYKYIYDRNKFLAWTMLFGKNMHHVALETDNIYHLSYKLLKDGYTFNKTSKCDTIFNVSLNKKVIQSSLIEMNTIYHFTDGSYKIPFTYIELIEKYEK